MPPSASWRRQFRLIRSRPEPLSACRDRAAAAEEHAVDVRRLVRRAIHADKRRRAFVLGGVNGAGNHLAARAFLASNRHARLDARRARNQRDDLAHRRRMAVERIAGHLERARPTAARRTPLALERVDQASGRRRPRKHIGHAGQHGLGRQIGPLIVDHGEQQDSRPLGAQVARHLQRRGAARQIDEHRHLAPLQLVERLCAVVRPDDGHAGAGEDFLGRGAFRLGTADVEDGFHGRPERPRAFGSPGAWTGAKWPSPAASTSSRALPSAP